MNRELKNRTCLMRPGKCFAINILFICFVLVFSQAVYAFKDTVNVADFYSTGREGTLNEAVQSAINSGTLSATVFKLKNLGRYVLNHTIRIPKGQHLEIVADPPGSTQQTAPPQILWSSSDTVYTDCMFECSGGISLKNVWLLFADTYGLQQRSSISVEADTTVDNEIAMFEGVIFDYSSSSPYMGSIISVSANHFKGYFINCYFKNNIDPEIRTNSIAVTPRDDYHIESLVFENCTFANLGSVYNQSDGGFADNIKVNHCTFLNTMHNPLRSGLWYKISVTNSIFVNTFMIGDRTDLINPYGGTLIIERLNSSDYYLPFSEEDRRILFANSSYYVEDWLIDWMDSYFRSVNPQPMMNLRTIEFFNSYEHLFMNKINLYDYTDPGFLNAPTSIDSITAFLNCEWDCGKDWAYMPESSIMHRWPLNENLAYTNDTLLIASMGGFPLGDLYHWFPDEYSEWQSQKFEEDTKIANWLEDGTVKGNIPPPPPRNLTALPMINKVKLHWQPIPKMAFSRYNIYGGRSPERLELMDSTCGSITNTMKVIDELDSDSAYYFCVTAVNSLGIESEFSEQVSVRTFSDNEIRIVHVPSDYPGIEGTLNENIEQATEDGLLSITEFVLEAGGYYVLTDSIYVPPGEHLTIVAPEPGQTPETAPPQILCHTSNSSLFYMDYMFYCRGDITLKNIWLYYANTEGWQNGVTLMVHNDSEDVEQKGVFENVIFDYSSIGPNAGGAVTVKSKHFTGTFTNCYWKNCTNPTFRYYGRAVSFPFQSTGLHIDSLTFENCTFANIGYVLMQENGEYSDYVKFNHCTFLNTTMYTLESGWWHKLSVTNSIFVNAFMMGYTEMWSYGIEGGTVKIDSVSNFGFDVPFTEQDRRILFTNTSYGIQKWLQDYMWNNPRSINYRITGELDRIPHPQPMMNESTINFFESEDFPYMNKADLYNPSFPSFIYPPTDTTAIKEFLLCDWFSGCDIRWEWKPENSLNRIWTLEENLAYTNDTLLAAGMGGFPLGDIYRWYPDKYKEWGKQKDSENKRINIWLENGKDPGIVNVDDKFDSDISAEFSLYQNYPNPFNPTTRIDYSVSNKSHVTIKVYDLLGRIITTLFDGIQNAGNHSIKFDAVNLSSGIYFYQLKTEEYISTRKMLLMK